MIIGFTSRFGALLTIAAALVMSASAQLSDDGRALIISGVTGDQFDDALGDFLQDGSQAETMVKLARNGHPTAIRTIAHRCLYNDVCPVSRKDAHDMLAAHAQTDGESATELGVIYHWGKYGAADDVAAAQWLGHAHALGGDNALLFLKNLDPDAVERAGLTHLVTKSAPRHDKPITSPAVLPWPDKGGFRVFADTPMHDSMDAALSCHLVLGATVDAEMARFARLERLSRAEYLRIEIVNDAAEQALNWLKEDQKERGLSDNDLNQSVIAHSSQQSRAPDSGPTAEFCQSNLLSYRLNLMQAEAGLMSSPTP